MKKKKNDEPSLFSKKELDEIEIDRLQKIIKKLEAENAQLKSENGIYERGNQHDTYSILELNSKNKELEAEVTRLQAENAQLKSENTQLETSKNELKAELEKQKPKVEAYDDLIGSKTLFSTTIVAKSFGWSAQRLNQYLVGKKIQFQQGHEIWILYQKYAQLGLTGEKIHDYYTDENGKHHAKAHTYWTIKGMLFIRELLKKDGLID